MNHRTITEHKGIAREKLLGRYTVIIGAILILQLILFAVGSITAAVVDTRDPVGLLIYTAISIIVGLITAVFTVGEYMIYLNLSRGGQIRVTDIFAGFFGHPDKAIILQFFISVRCLAYMIPAFLTLGALYLRGVFAFTEYGDLVMTDASADGLNRLLMLFNVIFIIGGMIGVIYVRLALSQCIFLLIDSPEYEVKQIMEKSKALMRGRMWEYLYLRLSFIPISILGLLSLGVGLMYIRPYVGVACTEYYLSIASGKGGNIDIVIDD